MDKAYHFISKIYSLSDDFKNKIITYDDFQRKLSLTVLQLPEEKIRFNPIFTDSLTIQNTVQPYPERSGSWFEYYFTNERGKIRDIDAPHIKDRLVHKVISNDTLIPIFDSKLIYDNGASSIGKGFSFAIKRVKKLAELQ